MRRIAAAISAVVVVLALVAFSRWRRANVGAASASSAAAAKGASAPTPPAREPAAVAPAIPVARAAAPTAGGTRTFGFGAGRGELGTGTTPEGRPVAPSSFVATSRGLVILDQENQRIVLEDGSTVPLPSKHADDLARTKDGFAVLDRDDRKEVLLLDASGRVTQKLPLEGAGVDDPRDVSRMIVSGDDVLVEQNGGGPLLDLRDRSEVQGIPTRDGKYLVSAGITDEDQGRAWVTLAHRGDASHVWTRELRFPAELTAVGFVGSDSGGPLWVVLLAGSSSADYLNWAVCMDPTTGEVRGSFNLSVEEPPYESFRDFAVEDGAGLVAASRSAAGVSYTTYPCR